MVSGQLPPEENCSPVRVGVWVKVRVNFTVGGNQTIAPDENCPPVRVRGCVRVLGMGAVFLGGNCPRTNIDVQMTVLSIHEILL